VGVGQSETKVSSMVDFFLVLMLAGAGDELQGIKKGVLELADTIAVNKADGDNTEKAAAAASAYEIALHMLQPRSANWNPPVLTCSGREETGLGEIWETIVRHRAILESAGELEIHRRNQAVEWMRALIHEGLEAKFFKIPEVVRALPVVQDRVVRGEMSPTTAARELLFFLDNHFSV
jgi:LAO/AO transport system kinase